MRSGRLSPGTTLPVVAALTLFAFACGSSSVPRLQADGSKARWVLLLALLAAAALWAWERRPLRVPGPVPAAAALFAGIALLSTAWSVDPRLSFERAATLAVLVAAAALVAAGAPGRVDRVLAGLVGGGVLVALAGLVVLAVRHREAVQVATTDLPARFQGMGENPDTVSLLLALLVAPALALALGAADRRARVVAALALALFAGSIVASGSHGATVAAAGGAATVALLVPQSHRLRAAGVAAAVVALAVAFGIERLPQPAAHNPPPPTVASAPTSSARPGYTDAEQNFPLSGELGVPAPGTSLKRGLVTSSGRLQAWGGALRQAEARPVAGYGFGTEARVFVDRWSTFTGSVPESSYLGIALQLGVAGLVAFALVVVAVGGSGLRLLRLRDRVWGAACLGVVAAGLVIAIVQSYLYSVGDVGTVTLWTAALLLPAAVAGARA